MRAAPAAIALALFCFGLAGCNREHSEERSLEFLDRSRPVASLTVTALEQKVELREVEVFEPHQRTKVVYEALALPEVLDAAYGPSWRQREAIVFSCRDGYEPTIAVQRVLSHQAFVAVGRPKKAFRILEHRNGAVTPVDLGPFYIIWENLDDAQVRIEDDYGWPYQVVRVDLVSFRSRFGDMVPDPEASKKIWAGFEAFVIHCSRCHTINGQGGKVGPELNYPANPTEYMKAEWLRRWIDDPTSMRHAPRMPPLNPLLPDRAKTIDDIVTYLRAMSSHKVEPKSP